MKLSAGQEYPVKVIKLLNIGAIVEMPDKSTELVHISQISDKYVKSVEYFLSVGDELVARCVECNGSRPLQLSFKHLDLQPIATKLPVDRELNAQSLTKQNNFDRYVPDKDKDEDDESLKQHPSKHKHQRKKHPGYSEKDARRDRYNNRSKKRGKKFYDDYF